MAWQQMIVFRAKSHICGQRKSVWSGETIFSEDIPTVDDIVSGTPHSRLCRVRWLDTRPQAIRVARARHMVQERPCEQKWIWKNKTLI